MLSDVRAHARLALKQFGADQSGSVAIEFAVGLIVLLALLFGMMSYGEVFFTQMQVNNIAGDTARELVVRRNADDRLELLTTSRERWLQSLWLPECGTIAATEDGAALTVRVSYDFTADAGACRLVPSLPFVPLPDRVEATTSATLQTE